LFLKNNGDNMGIDIYNKQAAVTEDPYMLILKLYEGLTKYLSFVKDAIENDNIEEKFTYINKSIAIFDELRNILDFDGGDVAYYLDGLYLYQIETLFSAGIDNNLTSIDQVSKVVKGLTEAWKEETGL
jgi:flagellar protein FliS